MSVQIKFEKLTNTRDLGGMITQDGRKIRPGKLIRSGHLYSASAKDKAELAEKVSLVVDFRTEQERSEKPDPALDGTDYLHLPIFESLAAGVTREEKSNQEAFAMVSRDPDMARRYMQTTYLGFVTSEFSISQYARFIRLLLKQRDKAVLWHCTAGKDRAGFASGIVQELLGVPREAIIADYLETNRYLKAEVDALYQMVGVSMGGLTDKIQKALEYMFGAHQDYLEAVYEEIRTRYGSFEGFATNGLKLTREEIAQFKELYLEQ